MAVATNGKVTEEFKLLQISPLQTKTIRLRVVGTSPMMTHQWDSKAIRQMEDKQQGEAKTGLKAPKVPEEDFEAAIYRLPDGSCGVPARAFKKAVITAATHVDGITKTFLRTAFHVLGDSVGRVNGEHGERRPTDLIRIEGDAPEMRTDMVRVGGISKSADVRYRPEWGNWACWVTVRYNARSIGIEQLVQLFNLAGFGVGIGEWRPEKDGMHGMFEVQQVEEMS